MQTPQLGTQRAFWTTYPLNKTASKKLFDLLERRRWICVDTVRFLLFSLLFSLLYEWKVKQDATSIL